jgi:hypothetical protein
MKRRDPDGASNDPLRVLLDGQRAVSLVRSQTRELGI